jgi:outer membrane protein
MMKSYNRWMILPLLLCLWQTSYATDLVELYQKMMLKSNLYQASIQSEGAQESEEGEARAALLPQLGIEAEYGRQDSQTDLATSFSYIDQLPTTFHNSDNVYGYMIGLKQDVVNVKSWRTYAASKLMVKAKKLNEQIVRQQLAFDMLVEYFAVLQSNNKLLALNVEKNDLQRLKRLAKFKLEQGKGTRLSLYKADMNLQEVLTEIMAEKNIFHDHLNRLELQVGERLDYLRDLNTDVIVQLLPPKTADYWVDQIKNNNPGLKKAQIELQALQDQVDAQKAEAYPVVFVKAEYTQGRESLPFVNSVDSTNQMVELGAKVPLFAGGYIHAKTNRLEHELSQGQYQYDDAEQQLIRITRDIFYKILALREKLRTDREAIIVTEKTLTMAKNANKQGLGSLNDVLSAENFLYKTKVMFKNDAYDAVLLRAKLDQLNGNLNEQSIVQFNKELSLDKIFVITEQHTATDDQT